MRARVLLGLGLSVGLIAPACRKDRSEGQAGAASAAPSVNQAYGTTSAPSAPAESAAALPGVGRGRPLGVTLGAMLVSERASRPAGGLRAEEVFAAFAKQGIVVEEPRQHLGAPVGARYCLGGTSKNGVAMSVCEYADAAAAEVGRAESTKAFAAIANRRVELRRATTLTVLPDPPTDVARAEARKVTEIFALF